MANTIKIIDMTFLTYFLMQYDLLPILEKTDGQAVTKKKVKSVKKVMAFSENLKKMGQRLYILMKLIFTFFLNIQYFKSHYELPELLNSLRLQHLSIKELRKKSCDLLYPHFSCYIPLFEELWKRVQKRMKLKYSKPD